MDNLTDEQRSETMRAVKSEGSEIERLLFKEMETREIGSLEYHVDDLPGTPDLVHRETKIAVFADSCYWHGCPEHFSMPESNQDYWEQKIESNKRRDREVTEQLESEGWLVKRIWGHSIKDQRSRRWWATRIETLVNERVDEKDRSE